MIATVFVRPRARRDLADTASYLAGEGGVALGERFLRAAQETFATLARMPGMGVHCGFPTPRLAELRHFQLKGFSNWLVFYEITAAGIDVVHVIHGARDIRKLLEE